MKFFEDISASVNKQNQIVCGDTYICERGQDCTVFVLCDGIGSGIYANIASISCANRLISLISSSIAFGTACEMVAESMHRARTEDIPFSAFSAVKILNDGNFIIYTYEAPDPILIRGRIAHTVKPRFYTVGYEVIGESFGMLEEGDAVFVCSDGATQAGLGYGYPLGLGSDGIADFINHLINTNTHFDKILTAILDMTKEISCGRYADDTTAVFLHCREAKQLTIMTGPPQYKSKDNAIVHRLIEMPGLHVVCGSTTADIISRELKREVTYIPPHNANTPPEYLIDGIDIVTEGAIMLNQLYNIMWEDPSELTENTVVVRLCKFMHQSDVVTFLIGGAINEAHQGMLFKQIGIRPRADAVSLIIERLRELGKLVITEYF